MKKKNTSVADVNNTSTNHGNHDSHKNLMTIIVQTIIAFFLIIAPLNMQAQFSGGSGQQGNPFIITSAEQLATLAELVNNGAIVADFSKAYYRLGNDIDLSGYQDGEGWIPIGHSDEYAFRGYFDGYDNKITGLKINTTSLSYVGLFGYVDGGTITDLYIENASIVRGASSEHAYAGIVAGSISFNSAIVRCYSSGSVSAEAIPNDLLYSYVFAGGTAGFISNNSMAYYCRSTATISASANYTYSGGIAGYLANNSNISCCSASGSITSTNCSGGIAGCIRDGSEITHCYATGPVSAIFSTGISSTYAFAGGIVGNIENASVSYCYSTGAVSGTNHAGGIVGQLFFNSITNCVALNPSITRNSGNSTGFERVLGYTEVSDILLDKNFGFADMINPDGEAVWHHIGADDLDGASITKEEINADGTLNGTFPYQPWAIQNGKLPGLYDGPVDMPEHLQISEDIWGCMDPDALNYNPDATKTSPNYPCIYSYLTLIAGNVKVSEDEPYYITITKELVNIGFEIYAPEISKWIIKTSPEDGIDIRPNSYSGAGNLENGIIIIQPNPGTVRTFEFSVSLADNSEKRTVIITQYGESDVYGCMDPKAKNYNEKATATSDRYPCIYESDFRLIVSDYEVSENIPYRLTITQDLTNIAFAIYAPETPKWYIKISPEDSISIQPEDHSGFGNLGNGIITIMQNPFTVRTFEFIVFLGDDSDMRRVIITQYGDKDVWGCMDPKAKNYNEKATVWSEKDPCEYEEAPRPVYGCMDPKALNYNEKANSWSRDYPCVYDKVIWGCIDQYAINYNKEANANDGSCIYRTVDDKDPVYGCMDSKALNFDPVATVNTPDRCIYNKEEPASGCTDPKALNYDPYAKDYIEGSCIYTRPDRKVDEIVPKEPDGVVGTFTQENCDLVVAINNFLGVHIYSVTIVKVEPAQDGNTLVSWEIKLENGFVLATTAEYPIPYSLLEGKDILFYLSFICDLPNLLRSANPDLSYTFCASIPVPIITDISQPEPETKKWTVYPNPTTGELRIENGELKIESVEIYDISGKKILNYQLSTLNSLDISHFSKGIYFLKINNEMVKVIKQ